MTAAAQTAPHYETGAKAFDFLHGRWSVRHRQLKARHVGSDEWVEYDGTCGCEPRLGGILNVEEHDFVGRGGAHGFALRTFNLTSGEWSVYWVADRDGVLGVPVVGRFDGPGCVLEGEDTDGGRPIQQRYIWSRTDTANPRWEQAYSIDGGQTWETNWVMDWTRIG